MDGSNKLTLFHNPRCSKSRAALQLLIEQGVDVEVIEYLKTPPDAAALRRIISSSDSPPIAFVRTGDAEFEQRGVRLADDAGIEAVVDVLVRHPSLLQRPVLVSAERSVIGRPPELVLELVARS